MQYRWILLPDVLGLHHDIDLFLLLLVQLFVRLHQSSLDYVKFLPQEVYQFRGLVLPHLAHAFPDLRLHQHLELDLPLLIFQYLLVDFQLVLVYDQFLLVLFFLLLHVVLRLLELAWVLLNRVELVEVL